MQLNDPGLLRSQAYIDGKWIDAESGATFDIVDPASGDFVGSVTDAGPGEARRAIEAADAAFAEWRDFTANKRARILQEWRNLILDNREDLALLMTHEMGKPINEARGEVAFAASFIEWFAEEGKRAYGEIIPTHDPSKRLLVLKQPVGVVAAITPWNFPLAMITRKVAPALAAGCTVVVKPPEDAPLTALAAAELADRAGIPPGVLNVVPTSNPGPVGGELTSSPVVRKLSFTGSTATGKKLLAQAAGTVKNVSMELGGNAPFLVFDDADIDAAVEGAMVSKYRNNGQTCICANRIYVQDGVYDEFAKKFAEKVAELRVGPAVDESTNVGPLVNDAALAKVEGLVDDALAKGASALTGGKRHALGRTYYEVTVLTGVTPEMRISAEEIFGPVAPLYRFETEEEAIALANDTPYGLASYFFAGNLSRIWRVSEGLEYGMVGVNTGMISVVSSPFGGVKESGIGREGSHEGLAEYLETKFVTLGGI
jgi:succinate-semialdehyde dehydrogenase/glutarate-semialdehyde dehydrogenase